MHNRSSMGETMKDENETAYAAILQAPEDGTGPELLADVIGSLRKWLAEGLNDGELALRLWPKLRRMAEILGAEKLEELYRRGGASLSNLPWSWGAGVGSKVARLGRPS